jgi:hypothetical protein
LVNPCQLDIHEPRARTSDVASLDTAFGKSV